MRKIHWLLILYLLFSPHFAFADQPIDMLRVLCMPEKGIAHFSVDVSSFDELLNYIEWDRGRDRDEKPDMSETAKNNRVATLKKHGLILPTKFNYECKLPRFEYRIFGSETPHQATGMCGGDSRITISLQLTNLSEQTNHLSLDKVYFTPSCFADFSPNKLFPYISQIVIDEFVPGWGGSGTKVTISANGKGSRLMYLNYLNKKLTHPIAQADLNCLAKKGFFEPKTEQIAIEDCNIFEKQH